MPAVTEFHCVKYGTPKHRVAKIKNSVLVDDNSNVRESWNGITVNASENILPQLKVLLEKVA
jgi:hypothetical protein